MKLATIAFAAAAALLAVNVLATPIFAASPWVGGEAVLPAEVRNGLFCITAETGRAANVTSSSINRFGGAIQVPAAMRAPD